MTSISGTTQVYGILGDPVAHSLSPLMHNAAFSFHKMDAVYVPFLIKKPNHFVRRALLQMNLGGLSVTIPHKIWAAKIAEQKDSLTEYCNSANTLIPKKGKWCAFNTDGMGALQALKEELGELKGKSFLVLGYGGSAAAIAHALLWKEAPRLLLISGRSRQKREKFISHLKAKHPRYASCVSSVDYNALESKDVDVLIHTTPLGMQGKPQDLPLPAEFLYKSQCVFDIVYRPALTPLLRYALAKGCKTLPGHLMLLHQACLQFEIFTTRKAPQEIMKRELLAALKGH